MRTYLSRLRGFDRSLWWTYAAFAGSAFGYFGIQGVLLNLYLLRLGFRLEFIGLLIGSGQFVWALCALPAGWFGRRFGLRAALLGSYAVQVVGAILLRSVQALPPAWWEPWLIATNILTWMGGALNSVNNAPYLMALAATEERNDVFALQSAVNGMMSFVGSLIAGLLPAAASALSGVPLSEPGPYLAGLWFTPLAWALGGLALLRSRSVPAHDYAAPKAPGSAASLPLFLVLGCMVALLTTADGAVRAFFNVYLDTGLGISTAGIGAAMGFTQLLPVAAALLAPLMMRRVGAGQAWSLAAAGVAASLLLVAGVPVLLAAAVGYTGVMMMNAISGTARNVFSQQVVPPRDRTTISAVVTIGMAFGWASMAAAGGYIVQAVGFSGLFFLAAGLAATCSLLLALYLRSRRARA